MLICRICLIAACRVKPRFSPRRIRNGRTLLWPRAPPPGQRLGTPFGKSPPFRRECRMNPHNCKQLKVMSRILQSRSVGRFVPRRTTRHPVDGFVLRGITAALPTFHMRRELPVGVHGRAITQTAHKYQQPNCTLLWFCMEQCFPEPEE